MAVVRSETAVMLRWMMKVMAYYSMFSMCFPDKDGECSSTCGADEEGGDVESAAGQQPAAEERKGPNVPSAERTRGQGMRSRSRYEVKL